jgi:hypothetical protein
MNNFQINMAFKNNKNYLGYKKVAFTSKVMKNSQLMEYMVSGPCILKIFILGFSG